MRVVARPLGVLAAATQALSRGNAAGKAQAPSPEKIEPGHGDEIGKLAERFDYMAREVYSREERLRQARAEVARSEAHFRSLIEHATDAVMVLDANLEARYASPSVQRVFGLLTRGRGRQVAGVVRERKRCATPWRQALAATAATGVGPAFEFRCAGDGAPKYLERRREHARHPAVEGTSSTCAT